MIDKDLIKQRFSRSLPTYETNAVIQKEMAKELALLIDKKNLGSVLELGCGTGFLTRELIKNIKISEYDAIDIVADCKNYLSEIADSISFSVGDIESVNLSKKYDLIISNASLQWLENLEDFITKIELYINPNGLFVFSIFGKENYKEFKNFVKSPLNYLSAYEITKICNRYEIVTIKESIKKLHFETPKEILYHIRNTGVNAIVKTRWSRSDLDNFIKNYPKTDNNYELTYNPVYVVLKKK